MAQLTLDLSGRGGLAPKYFGDSDELVTNPQRKYIAGEGELVQGYFNPFQRYGYLSPAQATLTNLTYTGGTLDAMAGSVIYDAVNDDFYFAERGRQLWKGDGLDDELLAMTVDLGATGTPVIMDLEIYQINGTRKIFLVYEKSGNLYTGISSLPYDSGTDDPDWLISTVSGAFTNSTSSSYNFMRVADNGFAYIFADNTVHKVDGTTSGGTNGTVYPNTLLFPPFFRITDALDYRGLMFIVVHQTTQDTYALHATKYNNTTPCGVYIWDRLSSVVQTRDYVPVQGIRAIRKIYVAPNGAIRLLCIAANNMVQIREYNGSQFQVIKELGMGAASQYPDSLIVANDVTYWVGTDGIIYAHGSVAPGQPEVLAQLGYVKAPVTTSSKPLNVSTGAMMYAGGEAYSGSAGFRQDRQSLYIAYWDSTGFIKRFYPYDKGTIDTDAQLALQGDIYTANTLLPTMSTVKDMTIYMAQGTATGSTVQATIKIYFNGSSTAWASKSVTRDNISVGYVNFQINKQYVNSIQVEIEYATGTTMSDTYDFHPSYAIVNYDPTNTVG